MLLGSRATAFFVPHVARPKKNDFVDEPSIGSFAVFSRGRRLKPTLLRDAGPWPVFDICDKAGFDGIVFDVIFLLAQTDLRCEPSDQNFLPARIDPCGSRSHSMFERSRPSVRASRVASAQMA